MARVRISLADSSERSSAGCCLRGDRCDQRGDVTASPLKRGVFRVALIFETQLIGGGPAKWLLVP